MRHDYEIVAYRVSVEHGLDGKQPESLARDIRLAREVEVWVQEQGRGKWAWLHPRVQWTVVSEPQR